MKTRKEYDSIGSINVPVDKYWGASTQRSKKYFDIGEFKVRPILIKSIAIIKKSAAIVHKKEKQIDQQVLAMWRTVCIHSLINHMPKNMRRLAKFRDLDSAMKWLEALSGRVTVNKWGE